MPGPPQWRRPGKQKVKFRENRMKGKRDLFGCIVNFTTIITPNNNFNIVILVTNTTAAIVIIILFMTFFSAALALSSALFSCSFIMLRDLPKSSWLASLLVAADQNLMPVMCLWWFPTIPSRDYGFCQYGSGFKHVILSVFIWGIVFLRGILKKKIDIDTFVASYSKLRSSLIARELIMANGILDQRQDKDKTLPKAQRTRGLSSSCQSNFLRSNTNPDHISSSESQQSIS